MDELLKAFHYGEKQVRTIKINNDIWFVLSDVCRILELSTPSRVKERLGHGVSSTHTMIDSLGRKQDLTIINEDGLYDVILDSRKPEAKLFRKWITSDLLPTIRKTGGYVAKDDLFIETYLPYSDEQTKSLFKITLETIRQLNEDRAILIPKAKYYDELVDCNMLTNFRDVAKELKIGQKFFIEWLLDNKYLYRDHHGKLKPYMKFVPNLFQLREWTRNGKADI